MLQTYKSDNNQIDSDFNFFFFFRSSVQLECTIVRIMTTNEEERVNDNKKRRTMCIRKSLMQWKINRGCKLYDLLFFCQTFILSDDFQSVSNINRLEIFRLILCAPHTLRSNFNEIVARKKRIFQIQHQKKKTKINDNGQCIACAVKRCRKITFNINFKLVNIKIGKFFI